VCPLPRPLSLPARCARQGEGGPHRGRVPCAHFPGPSPWPLPRLLFLPARCARQGEGGPHREASERPLPRLLSLAARCARQGEGDGHREACERSRRRGGRGTGESGGAGKRRRARPHSFRECGESGGAEGAQGSTHLRAIGLSGGTGLNGQRAAETQSPSATPRAQRGGRSCPRACRFRAGRGPCRSPVDTRRWAPGSRGCARAR